MDLSKHLQKADEAARRRNYPLAIGLYQQILDLDADCEEARAGLRAALDKKFEGRKGGGVLAWIQGFLPLLTAGLSKLTKNWAGRARNLERYLALSPNNAGMTLSLGEALYRAGHNKSAYVVYRHLGEKLAAGGRQSSHAEQAGMAWRLAGGVAHELKRLEAAMECFEQAIAVNPRDQDALRARKNLSAEGQLERGGYATAQSTRDLVKDKDALAKLEKQQRIHRSEDELAGELKDAEARLEASPDDAALLAEVGELRAAAGDLGGALDCLETALRKSPDDFRLLTRVGELQIKEIENDLAKAQKLGDSDKVARLEKRVQDRALDLARKRVEAHPTDLGLRHELGLRLVAAGQLDAAIAELQKSVKDPRHKLEALLHLGKAFRDKGMPGLARSQLEKALEATGTQHGRALDLLYELGAISEEENKLEEARSFYSRILEVDIGYKDVSSKLEALKAQS